MTEATILLADDNIEFLSTRAEWLEREGYNVIRASNPIEARKVLEEQAIDVAVLDLRLENSQDSNDISGLTIAKEVARSVPKVILTAYHDLDAVREALALDLEGLPPAVGFVLKQEEIEGMIRAIERALALRGHFYRPDLAVLDGSTAWALLVGINHYSNELIPDLSVCVADVTAVCESLGADYYAVRRLLTDDTPDQLPTRNNILAELMTLSQSAGMEDVLLFYFSGHGGVKDNKAYLIPMDARPSALGYTAVSVRDVIDEMTKSPARAKIMVLDACHSGADLGKSSSIMTSEFLRHVFLEAEGIIILASCTQGQRSWEWKDKSRSAFTYYLCEALNGKADLDKKGFVTVTDVHTYVGYFVKRWAVKERGEAQVPTLEGKMAGNIVLNCYRKP